MTDAERIAELEEMLRQRDARIAELERTVGELSKVIDAWKRGHRVRPGGKIAQKPRDKRRATGRGSGRPEGPEGTSRPAPTSTDRDVTVPLPPTCSCGGIIDPTGEEPGEHFVEELIPARKEVIRLRRCRGAAPNAPRGALHTGRWRSTTLCSVISGRPATAPPRRSAWSCWRAGCAPRDGRSSATSQASGRL